MPWSTPIHRGIKRDSGKTPSRAIDDGFYSLARWRRLRSQFLADHPWCADPYRTHALEQRPEELATDVHHLQPRRLRPDLAFDPGNLQGLCHGCHSRLTKAEGGGRTA
jgi:5-methylcytosine-specific restriction protein A